MLTKEHPLTCPRHAQAMTRPRTELIALEVTPCCTSFRTASAAPSSAGSIMPPARTANISQRLITQPRDALLLDTLA